VGIKINSTRKGREFPVWEFGIAEKILFISKKDPAVPGHNHLGKPIINKSKTKKRRSNNEYVLFSMSGSC
jgi:hypothetical protein